MAVAELTIRIKPKIRFHSLVTIINSYVCMLVLSLLPCLSERLETRVAETNLVKREYGCYEK